MIVSTLRTLLLVSLLSACDKSAKVVSNPPAETPAPPKEASSLPAKISFNEHIQPILSENCYHCHGPDAKTREPKDAPLRLDLEKEAFLPREDGKPVILKGKPAESKFVELIRSKDPDSVMPPPQSHKKLKPEEIALFEEWIRQGAVYEPHWSFVPVKMPELPAAGDGWAANPIDRFIAEKLDTAGFKPNPPENPRAFYRRLHLDLTGLPPAPAAIDAFEKSVAILGRQAAVDKAADELLASTPSAENFARHWLDAARYADTHGIHIDNYRSIWPYRDWVVRAFQSNMPWDQFTTEQIAGDMLPNRTLDQQVATGFGRCLATTGEGGAIGEEYEAIYAKDRVETVSAIWLGLTTGCAACHDHKFDPISTKEFYSLTAFFRNTPMSPLDGNNAEHPPNVFVPLPDDRKRWDSLPAEITSVDKQLAGRAGAARGDFDAWLAKATVEPSRDTDSSLAIHLPLIEADGPLHGTVDGQPREWAAQLPRIDAPLGKAPQLNNSVELGDIGSFSRSNQVTYGGFIYLEGTPTGSVIARMNPAESYRGWDLYLEDGRAASHVIDTWASTANKIVASAPLKSGEWHHVMVTFNGSAASNQASAIYIDGKPAIAETVPATVGGKIETAVPLRLGSRQNGEAKLNGKVALQDFRFYRRLLTPEEISSLAQNNLIQNLAAIPADQRTKEQVESLFKYYLANLDGPSRDLRGRLDGLKSEQSAIRARGSVSLVMEEKKSEPFAHVLTRGVYSAKAEKVTPTTPAVLPPMAADAPKNRLSLAHWLNDPANPLPARVTMNRTWYYLFGTGIVETTEDFGIMGGRPSHPKLLDWLASEFVGSKWDYRHMLKLMVTSATYQQSEEISPEKLERDPSNRLLTRGPRHRLDAEQIRDLALSASGLLNTKVGGPPVKPYQPDGIWEAVAMKESNTRYYKQDQGDNLYRRSIYTMWKRTAAPPSMEIFNAPTRETFCVRRDRTNTPLQALVLLNDPQFVEASRELAANAIKSSTGFDQRLDFITRHLDGRDFTPDERVIVRKTLDTTLAGFRQQREDAAKLVATGAKAPPTDIDAPELAAWTLVASQILNLDETISR